MFLNHAPEQVLIEVLNLHELWDPFKTKVWARAHAGEEMQDPEFYPKAELLFPSGESLPKAWIDPHYRANVPMPEHLSAAAATG
ncbi:acetyltransferase [Picosynechococcus sp. PCC 7117]|uniref:acetyltransferase n=1 Tax=Picosynechococcus sp. PCC 7117 TaxID=195498 RepID=UPI0008106666|nr:acetyltransferase [Picosynechococcus sp. PCC 7117]ANV87542.1 acetyltransferase [Picosynechococcus sp. PCC 7117]